MKPDYTLGGQKNGNTKEDEKVKIKLTDEDKKTLTAFEEELP